MIHSKIATAVMGMALGGLFIFGAHTALAGSINYKIVGEAIPKSLTDKSGDPIEGRKTTINRKKGNCLACHKISDVGEQPFHGKVGPPLDDVGDRLSAAEIRLRIVNPKVINPDTIMPAFFKKDGFHRLQKKWKGKTIISAQDVEDIVAYMQTLKGKYSK